jgi:hypothetical protein
MGSPRERGTRGCIVPTGPVEGLFAVEVRYYRRAQQKSAMLVGCKPEGVFAVGGRFVPRLSVIKGIVMIAPSAAQAQALLRDPAHFQWYVITLLLVVFYAYGEQAAEQRWSVVLGGLAFWLMDWVNEIWNGLLFHFSGFAPAWGTPGASAYVILIGLNIEISFMFLLMGLYAVRLLPKDRHMKILGINNRWALAAGNSVLCVIVEVWLNHIGALTWEWSGWNAHAPWLIWLIGYMPFYVVAYRVHDLPSRKRQIAVVGTLAAVVVVALGVFGGMLGWI